MSQIGRVGSSACGARAPRSDALSPWDHFLALCFAQLTFRQSLRDIEACLRAQPGLAYHLGFRGAITRSALARANEQREWQPWAMLARKHMPKVRALYQAELDARSGIVQCQIRIRFGVPVKDAQGMPFFGEADRARNFSAAASEPLWNEHREAPHQCVADGKARASGNCPPEPRALSEIEGRRENNCARGHDTEGVGLAVGIRSNRLEPGM